MKLPVQGIFRRRIIADVQENRVFAGVEDDFHHYEILITHDGSVVTAIEAKSLRTPWVTCPEAMGQLDQFIGAPLSVDVFRRRDLPDPHFQCTHMFETALLAIAQAVRGGRRQYDIVIPDRVLPEQPDVHFGPLLLKDGRTHADLFRDGAPILSWTLKGWEIASPAPFAGQTILTVGGWAVSHFDDEELEAIKILRRGVHVAGGRTFKFDSVPGAFVQKQVYGACYVFQPERVERAFRVKGANRDFSSREGDLLADMRPDVTRSDDVKEKDRSDKPVP